MKFRSLLAIQSFLNISWFVVAQSTPTAAVHSSDKARPSAAVKLFTAPASTSEVAASSCAVSESETGCTTPFNSAKKRKTAADSNVNVEMREFFAEQRKLLQEAVNAMNENVKVGRERNELLKKMMENNKQ